MKALVIGGTRNLGPSIVDALLVEGYGVAVLHRGLTRTQLPAGVEELFADRAEEEPMRHALGGRDWDLVVDTTLYNEADADLTVGLLDGRAGRYVVLSTGQVYLVRAPAGQELHRPYSEAMYDGPLMPRPSESEPSNLRNWLYGVEKRGAEDRLFAAFARSGFPVTALRMPMINSERDHYGRLENYLARLLDRGPILVPEGPHLSLCHVYAADVVDAVLRAGDTPGAVGRAYNISQSEDVPLEEFLGMVAEAADVPLRIEYVPRARLEQEELLPSCSPFSDPWMSALDNELSREELGMEYTPLAVYLQRLTKHFLTAMRPLPGYGQRPRELALSLSL